MAAPIDFHFDFISPYGFFASRQVEAMAARHGRTVRWRPMLLGVAVLKVMGLKPLLDTPLKGDYVRKDVRRIARREGIVLGRDLDAPVGNPLPAPRAYYWTQRHRPEQAVPVAQALYHAFWMDGRDLSSPEQLADVAWPEGIDGAAIAAGAASEEASALLRQAVDASLKAGVFGSPTFVVDGEAFWGYDRLAEVDAWLASGGW